MKKTLRPPKRQGTTGAKKSTAIRLRLSISLAAWLLLSVSCTTCKLASGDFTELQARVDSLEAKAVAKQEFSAEDKAFLRELYGSLVFGGRLLGYREAADMLDRYLAATGEPLRLDSKVYEQNAKVQDAMRALEAQIRKDHAAQRLRERYVSQNIGFSVNENARLFYFSNVFVLQALPREREDGSLQILFRVELPGRFNSYDEEMARFGRTGVFKTPFNTNAKGETFTIDDGLSQYLVVLGLAKEFIYYSEWTFDHLSR